MANKEIMADSIARGAAIKANKRLDNLVLPGGTLDHSSLTNRNKPDQHGMIAITGLIAALNGKQPTGDYAAQASVDKIAIDIKDLNNNKVEKEAGKGLSQNSFTNEEKTKLGSLSNYDDAPVFAALQTETNNRINADNSLQAILDTRTGLPIYNPTDYTIEFKTVNGTTMIISLPLGQIGLTYDEETKEMIFINAEGKEQRIPLADFIDIYVGSIGNEIQITVDKGNVIRAIILENTIAYDKLNTALKTLINSKANAADVYSKIESDELFNTKASLSYIDKLFLTKTSNTTATLNLTKPTPAAANYLVFNTNNQAINLVATITKTIIAKSNISKNNGLDIDLSVACSGNVKGEFGAKILKNGTPISTTQMWGLYDFNGSSLYDNVNDYPLNTVSFDLIENIIEFDVGDILTIELYYRQNSSNSINYRIFTGTTVNTMPRYSIANLNFISVNLNASSIADKAIALPKLADDVIQMIDTKIQEAVPTKTSELYNDSGFINSIKTINGNSLLGEGDIKIQGGSWGSITGDIASQVDLTTYIANAISSSIEQVLGGSY